MAIECPHCYSQILPLTNGRCPACREDTNRPSANPNRRSLLVTEKAKLPTLCCTCGQESLRVVGVTHSHRWGPTSAARCTEEEAGEGAAAVFGAFRHGFASIGGVLGLLVYIWMRTGSAEGTAATVHVRMRQCRTCSKSQPLKPLQVEYNFFTMRFVVCNEFADDYFVLNPSQKRT